jgi:hypothetical protein
MPHSSGPPNVTGGLVLAHAGLTYRRSADHHLDVHARRPVVGARAPFADVGLAIRF